MRKIDEGIEESIQEEMEKIERNNLEKVERTTIEKTSSPVQVTKVSPATFTLHHFINTLPHVQSYYTIEYECYRRLLYKNRSQHSKASYYHRLMGVRRQLAKIEWNELHTLISTITTSSSSSTTTAASTMTATAQSVIVFNSIDKFRAICSECMLTSPILIALLEQTYFMPFALTALAMLSRFFTISRNILYGLLFILYTTPSLSSLVSQDKTVILALYSAFRNGTEENILSKCCYMKLFDKIKWNDFFPQEQSSPSRSHAESSATLEINPISNSPRNQASPFPPSSPMKQASPSPPNISLVKKPSLLNAAISATSTFSLLTNNTTKSTKKRKR